MKLKSIFLLSFGILISAGSSAQYSLVDAFPKLPKFDRPLELKIANDGTNRMFVLEQTGKIYVFQNSNSVTTRKLFLDLSNVVCNKYSETGLLGMDFHPDYKTNKTFYLSYDTDKSGKLKSVIASFKTSTTNPDSAIKNSEKQLLVVDDLAWNHNGGCILFGPDKHLYFSFGDGGNGNDEWNNAQNLGVYWGKIHRINVADTSNGKKYGIPADNPFVNTPNALGEIYAYGLRNTWRFNFDLEDNNKIWAGDVGQNNWEEIDIITKGGNYGWRVLEGNNCTPGVDKNCNKSGYKNPIWTYVRNQGVSITGGYVYRGKKIPALIGKYVFADYQFGNVWALTAAKDTINMVLVEQNLDLPIRISSFAQDFDKELLLMSHGNGRIMRLVADNPSAVTDSKANEEISVIISPNPLAAKTTITLTMHNPGKVEMDLIDYNGKNVLQITNESRSAGEHQFTFDGTKILVGSYLLKIRCGRYETVKKLVKTD